MKKHPYSLNEIKIEAVNLNLAQPLGRFLITLFRQFEDEVINELHKCGYSVSITDLNAIRNIDPSGSQPVRMAELAGISKQAMSKQISKLEKQGFIKKLDDKLDSRSKLVVFTKKGEKLLHEAISIMLKIENRYANLLGGPKQLQQIKLNLHKLMT